MVHSEFNMNCRSLTTVGPSCVSIRNPVRWRSVSGGHMQKSRRVAIICAVLSICIQSVISAATVAQTRSPDPEMASYANRQWHQRGRVPAAGDRMARPRNPDHARSHRHNPQGQRPDTGNDRNVVLDANRRGNWQCHSVQSASPGLTFPLAGHRSRRRGSSSGSSSVPDDRSQAGYAELRDCSVCSGAQPENAGLKNDPPVDLLQSPSRPLSWCSTATL